MIRRNQPETLRDYLAEYTLTRPMEVESARQYAIVVDIYDRWRSAQGLDRVRLDELDELEVSAWLRDYAAAGAAPSTVRGKRVMLTTLWRAAADEGYCDPPLRRIRSQKVFLGPATCWAESEVVAILRACQGLKRMHRCGLPRSVWWELAVRVAWDSGLRWGDQVRLRVDQIPPSGLFAVVQHKTKRVQVCRFDEPTLELFHRSLKACPRDLVCPWMSSRESFNDQARTLVRKAGVRRGTWKWLRRASGTDVEVQQFGAAPRQLGHAPGSRIAYTNYVDPVIVAAASENIVWPRSLPRTDELGRSVT